MIKAVILYFVLGVLFFFGSKILASCLSFLFFEKAHVTITLINLKLLKLVNLVMSRLLAAGMKQDMLSRRHADLL